MKKSVLITLITVCMFWLVFFNVPECANAHTAGAWALDSIDSANSSGIIPPDMYAGDYTVPVTRREVAILIVNACENLYGPVQAEQYPFADTMGDAVVNKVCTLGIMNGRDDKTFSPHDNVTRQEMAKIMLEFKAYVKGTELELPVNQDIPEMGTRKINFSEEFGNGRFQTRDKEVVSWKKKSPSAGFHL